MKNWFGNIKIERKCVIIAGIDHTLLFFKNKQIINQEEIRAGNYEVIYDRDARLCRIKNVSTGKVTGRYEFEDIKTDNFMFEERCYYFHPYWLAKICEKILPKEKTHLSFLKRFHDDEIDVIAYETVQYNVIFIISQEATYVLLGGYGHNANPYTHFYHRGYGEEFETKMAKECYRWLCGDVLEEVLEYVCNWNEEDMLKEYQSKLRYKDYWNMTEEEKQEEFG